MANSKARSSLATIADIQTLKRPVTHAGMVAAIGIIVLTANAYSLSSVQIE
jgi:hypothetical protein